jgi:hypothetical protein
MLTVDDHLSHQSPVQDTLERVLDESLRAIPCRSLHHFAWSGHIASGGCGQVRIQSSRIAAMHAPESMPFVYIQLFAPGHLQYDSFCDQYD